MGQYYKPINLDNMQWINTHDFKDGGWSTGLKLMEHSWMKNTMVKTIESLIAPGGKWEGCRLVWAGDYANGEPGEYDDDGQPLCLYSKVSRRKKIIPKKSKEYFRYLVNVDTWEYVDKQKVPEDNDGWKIHPLPLLTCEGNGRGGGDFHGDDPNRLIGRWARNRITVQKNKPVNCKELIFDLKE